MIVLMCVLGAIGALMNRDGNNTASKQNEKRSHASSNALATEGDELSNSDSPPLNESKPAPAKKHHKIDYFSDEPHEGTKDILTIDGNRMEGINSVELVEGDTPAPFIKIVHSAGVRRVRPIEVPASFASKWGIENADVEKLISDIKAKVDTQIAAQKRANEAQQQKLLDEIGPEPKTSGWDGSVACVKTYIKQNVHDPSSLEFQQWFNPMLVELDNGHAWRVKVIYRAKNGFGAVVREIGYAYVRHNQVVGYERE